METINEEIKLLGKIIFKKYILKGILAKGIFFKIFLGQSLSTKKLYAIKCEKIISNQSLLKNEAFKLYNLKGFGIPELISFGRCGHYNFLVQTLLGKSLKSILIENNKKINIKDICAIAIQTLERIEFVHSKDYIHRDIKPDNFLLGNPDDSIIYLIDFKNAYKYRSSKTGKHIKPYKSIANSEIYGSKIFFSLNACRGYEQSRRDDLESLGYMYIYLAKGKLPWSEDFEKSNIKEFLKKSIFKKNIFMEDLYKDLPQEFCDYMNYVKTLNFEAKPNYEYLKGLFKNLLLNVDQFTWVTPKNNNKYLESHSFNINKKKSKIILERILKNINLNKKNNITKDLRNRNIIRKPLKKNNKLIFNKKNYFSIVKINSLKIEGIPHINNYNYIKNLNFIEHNSTIKTSLKKEPYYNIDYSQFQNFMTYIPRFPKLKNFNNYIDYNNINIKIDNNITDINSKKTNNNTINKKNNSNINKNRITIRKNEISSSRKPIMNKLNIKYNIHNQILNIGDNGKNDLPNKKYLHNTKKFNNL